MKKLSILLILTVLVVGITACGSNETDKNMSSTENTQSEAIVQAGDVPIENVDGTENAEQEDTGMQSDEEQIIAVYQKMQDAMVNKDTEYLRSVMGDEVRHITGRTQTIDEWLTDVEEENMKYYSIEIEDPKITIEGDRATLSCTNVIDARIYGSRGTWSLSGGAVFERIDGIWTQVVPGE